MIICSQCGRENEDHYKFCLGCGSQLSKPEPTPATQAPQMIACWSCGAMVPSNFKFCGACGSPITPPGDSSAQDEVAARAEPMNTNPVGPANSTTPPQDAGGGQAVASPSEPLPFESTSQLPTDSVHSSNAFAASSAVAKLVVIRPDGSEGATIPMHEGELIIGRSSEHEALAGDPFLSPQHASIKIRDSKFMINDLDSLNGIFYRIRGECELVSGDNIRMGQELLVFELMSEVPLLHEHAEGDDAETLGGGSPDVGYWGRLSLISGPDLVSRAFTFSEDEVTLGRERGDILFRDDGFVSGVHARLMKVDSQVLLKDLGSSNGTYVRIRKERELEDGDLILMGQQLFRLVA